MQIRVSSRPTLKIGRRSLGVSGRPASTAGRKPLGPQLRIIQIYYVVVMLVGFGYAALINPKGDLGFVYDLSMLRACIQLCTSAQAVYMLQRRATWTIPFCIVSTSVCTVLSLIDMFAMHANAPVFALLGPFASASFVTVEYVGAVVTVTYLALARHPREVLCVDITGKPEGDGHSWDRPLRERIRTWPYWRDLAIYFIVFSFLGHWAEILFCRLIIAGVFMGGYDPTNAMLWDQWLFPFSAEGIALAMVVVLLHPVKEKLVEHFEGRTLPALACSFAINGLICTSIDFGTGMVANQNYELWDYRDMPFNFMGQVCLQNSMVYTIAATLIVWVVYPLMDLGLRRIPRGVLDVAFFGLLSIYVFEAALHFIVPA